jgi:hypothetical protein
LAFDSFVINCLLFFLTWYNLKQLLLRRRTLDGTVTEYYAKTSLILAYEFLILFTCFTNGISF